MNVVFAYGVICGGGCERRLGQLMRWLLDRGDEVWLAASGWGEAGMAMLYGQCGVPRDRVLIMPPGGCYEDFLVSTLAECEADVVDIQWGGCLPKIRVCPAVYTMHGVVQQIPKRLVFDAILCIENLPRHHPALHHHPRTQTRVVWNWVDLERFRFQEALGEGACYVGRSFKATNAALLCEARPDIGIDGYGTDAAGAVQGFPESLRWLGYGRPEEFLYQYRVIFGCAIAAMEAMATGRLVIAGGWRDYGGRSSFGELVRPHRLPELSGGQYTAAERHDLPWPTAESIEAEFAAAMADDMLAERREIRRWLEAEHHPDIQMGKVRALYEEVIAG